MQFRSMLRYVSLARAKKQLSIYTVNLVRFMPIFHLLFFFLWGESSCEFDLEVGRFELQNKKAFDLNLIIKS